MQQRCMGNHYQSNKDFESTVYVHQGIAPKMHSINEALSWIILNMIKQLEKQYAIPVGML